jgi:hypothetical protein
VQIFGVPLTPGELLPDVAARDATGGAAGAVVPLRGLAASGPALLFVFKGDCPASPLCAAVLPRLALIPGLAIAAVSQDGPAEAGAFAATSGWTDPLRLLVDPEPWLASDALEVLSTPTWILVAPGGVVDRVTTGWSREDANALAARAAELAGVAAPVVSSAADDGPAFRPG